MNAVVLVPADEHHRGGRVGWLQAQCPMRPMPVAGSARGAVPAFRRARFPEPPSEPGVPVIPAPGSPRGPSPTTVALALGSAVPGLDCPVGTPVFTGGSCPADPPPQPRCAPSPCARLSRARTTTGTPPRPATNSGRRACPPPEGGEGYDGSLPTFTTTRSTRSVPSYTPAASPGVRRSPSPRPPHRPLQTGYGVARRHRDGRALLTGPDPPGWSRHVAYGASNAGSSRTPARLACRTRPVWQYRPVPALSGCSHPCVRLHGQAALSFTGLLRQVGGGALPSPPGRGSASWRR